MKLSYLGMKFNTSLFFQNNSIYLVRFVLHKQAKTDILLK